TPTHSLPLPNHPTPSLLAPRTPEAPYYIPPASDHTDSDNESTSKESDSEADDESSSDESMDHGGSNGTPAAPVVSHVDPDPPRTPSPPTAPEPNPRASSPIGIGARLPRRNRTKPREWWKLSSAQLDLDIDDDIEDADLAYEIAFSTGPSAELLSYSEAL
ncbi:hypothetical protein AZE42_12893, partial [Rhizopogon vesiculosus]